VTNRDIAMICKPLPCLIFSMLFNRLQEALDPGGLNSGTEGRAFEPRIAR
jgi:hypothetical protein